MQIYYARNVNIATIIIWRTVEVMIMVILFAPWWIYSAAAVAAWRFVVASFSPAAKTALSGEGVVRECVLIRYVLNIRSMNVRRWKLWRLVGVYESSHFCRVVVIATVFGNSTGVLNFCYQHVRVNIFKVTENSGCLNHHFYLEVAYLATIFRTMYSRGWPNHHNESSHVTRICS